MEKNYGILGGDSRNIKLAKLLAKENNIVYTYGLEKAEELLKINKIQMCKDFEEFILKAKTIIGPIPFTKDGTNVEMPYSMQKITIQDCIKKIGNKKFIVGQVKENVYNLAKEYNTKIIDIMKEEKLVILNTIATAEGTIQVLMENTDTVLHGMSVLILGFGRVAKILANKLYNLQMNVTCTYRNNEELAWIKSYGYKSQDICNLSSYVNEYDIIINTIPAIVIGKTEIQNINKKTLVVDLASHPGGIDKKEIDKAGIKYIWALGLPGKVAPETSARFIKETIEF